ncbi:MAG: carboxypeptidase-like regulatory domain-containing protein [Gemmataceae bacterium]|nr:carboxypeptidase-like regulatory domain-containing protein [Gemmataceae bacterium]MDW8265703.1 hypothetical protein [Gemmataceae bacterium]
MHVHRWTSIALLPILTASLIALGCGGSDTGKATKEPPVIGKGGTSGPGPVTGGGSSGPKTELAVSGWGSLKGRVTLDGDVPPPSDFRSQIEGHKDKDHCLKGDISNPTWKIGADKGVANVVVWLSPPAGKYFPMPPNLEQTFEKEKTLDQPECAFIPHVSVLFPAYYDGKTKKMVPTGQTFKVLNSAEISHNTRWSGSALANPARNETLKPKPPGGPAPYLDVTLKPDREPIIFNCDFHKWMTAYAWAFDHPFAAVTDNDGNYEIKTVPAGAEVTLNYWHESMGKTPKSEKITLKAEPNVKDLQIKR